MDRHIANSGKKHQDSEYHLLPTGLRKATASLADEYLHKIQTDQDQRYFYYLLRRVSTVSKSKRNYMKLVLCLVLET